MYICTYTYVHIHVYEYPFTTSPKQPLIGMCCHMYVSCIYTYAYAICMCMSSMCIHVSVLYVYLYVIYVRISYKYIHVFCVCIYVTYPRLPLISNPYTTYAIHMCIYMYMNIHSRHTQGSL